MKPLRVEAPRVSEEMPRELPPTIQHAVGYDEFWPFFMEVHRHPWTRRLHALATVIGLFCALILFPWTLNPAWLLIALGVSYPIAWVSHFIFERRRPAAFTNPFWAFLCDVEMLILMALGRMDGELEQLTRNPFAPPSARRRRWRMSGQAVMVAYIVTVLLMELFDKTRLALPVFGG